MTQYETTARDFFRAMQTGASAEAEMMALFAEDAVYVEPFTGRARTHRGKSAIRQTMRQGWSQPLEDLRIEVDRLVVDGDIVVADWTCYAPALPGGRGCGTNVFTL